MTLPNTSSQESALRKELSIFSEQFARLGNALLAGIFNLNPRSAHSRRRNLIILIVLIGFFISLKPYPIGEWGDRVQQLLLFLFFPSDNPVLSVINSMIEIIILGVQAYFNPYTLQHLPLFLLPFFIAYQAASFYLADIFNLDNVGIARKFISQVSLSGSEDVIRITKGDIAQEDLDSPIRKIGGPGKVIVDLDTVALFEKSDGRPNVIGPTGKEPKGKAILEGFERFRQAIDLRDHYIDLRDDEGRYAAVKSRSLDGIPVTATDVRMMFSIYRGGQEPTSENPYPYIEDAVEKLVYKSASKVTPDFNEPSQHFFFFESAILSAIRRELGRFMSQKKLTEYLASINLPEVKKAKKQENVILEEARPVLEPIESVDGLKKRIPPRPSFTPRHEITDLFYQFANDFTNDSHDKGVELHWIGIGTWIVPVGIVTEKHLDAWKMTRENVKLNSKGAIDNARNNARVQKILSMIQNVPLGVFPDGTNGINDRVGTLRNLFLEYRQQLNDNYEFLRKKKRAVPPTLVAALFFINRRIGRFIPPPPTPLTTQRERDLYKELRRKIGAFEVVERLIEIERETNPSASLETLLEKINSDWDQDIAGKWRG